ncbi:Acriflavine sensitivity control protein acr-2 [Madurella mycetomatis]|uniref:Acriflavine sensitivity control protein acr-2 n=1 Tax=Madurella mycetomatis TaxID=100816 RepID=A0A175WFS8_9PEZI|nr:Acriflavine sensitivity control protein acr-2 [Madurella mycetomatis]
MPGHDPVPTAGQSKACYNCRRRRLRCDRSRPFCHKCSSSGEECLGYGTVLRWANAPAIRGKLTNLAQTTHAFLLVATAVCRDLVSVDQHDRNPFRTIIPLTGDFDFLEALIIATGAMHLAALHGYQDRPGMPELVDALVAKDKAIRLLRSALDNVVPANHAMVLAATVFFINLDLIDSGKGEWQAHIEAASALMSTLHSQALALGPSLMSLVDAIAADCLTYRVLGSVISGVAPGAWADHNLTDLFSTLRRAEPYSYHCCPPAILQTIMSASSLCSDGVDDTRVKLALSLLNQARSLDVTEWVYSIRGLSAQDDLDARISLASAHRAAACLYILLAVPEIAVGPLSPDVLVREVLGHLASVPIDHVLLKGTVWPTFMAGAQTDDRQQREWCINRMQAVWASNPWICPWGYIRTAIQMLQDLWGARDQTPVHQQKTNWLQEIKRMRDKCLIV